MKTKKNISDFRPLILLLVGISMSFMISAELRRCIQGHGDDLLETEVQRIAENMDDLKSQEFDVAPDPDQIMAALQNHTSNFFVYRLSASDTDEQLYLSTSAITERFWVKRDLPLEVNGSEYILTIAPNNVVGFRVPMMLGILGIFISMISALFLRSHLRLREKSLELVQNQKELEALNHRLSVLNQEAEQYIYVASHDLQEPLNTINSFIDILHEDHPDLKENESVSRYLDFMSEASDRMKLLIKALLQYSQIGDKGKPEEVDTLGAVNDAVNNLQHRIAQSEAKVSLLSDMPKIYGYKAELTLLFQNLLSNAIKYARPGVKPEVEVSVQETNLSYHFIIKDNGIGINKKHFDSIFKLFHRLHNKKNYKGHGIGLAHCKKIIDLHKGKMRVSSAPGVGSTFSFELPKPKFVSSKKVFNHPKADSYVLN